MKLLSRVVWSEGMYLGPHHFQAQNRYFEDSIRFAIEHAWFEPWGFISLRLDGSAIENGRARVQHAHGIFEDGLIFEMPECDMLPPERNIREAFAPDAENLLIFLAIPKRHGTQQNCDVNGGSYNTRYRAVNRVIRDVNNGTDEKEISLCAKNIRLITKSEITDNMLTLPVARVRRDGAGHLVYDPGFVPPCSKLTANDWLMSFLGQLIELLDEKRKILLRPRIEPGKFQAVASQLDVSNFWFLHTINDGLTVLRHLYTSKRGHPEELFRELSRLGGVLCTFNFESDPNSLPDYDHRNLDSCFRELGAHIRRHLEILLPSNTIQIAVQQSHPNIYTGKVNDQRCLGPSRWILGIASSAGEAQVLTRAPGVVKVCSQLFVGELVKRAMPGLVLTHLPAPPSAISPRAELQYFSISKSGPCWNHITETRQVGIYVPDELSNVSLELQVILD
jgi:type VI secretion system protein ImpJ